MEVYYIHTTITPILTYLRSSLKSSLKKRSNSKAIQKMTSFKTKVKLENDYSNFIISSLVRTVANSSFRLAKEI